VKRSLPLILIVLAACVGPARTFSVYEGKAVSAAEAVRSAVETARIAAVAGAGGKVTGQFVSVVIHEAEIDASGAQGAFESIQPPDDRSDRIRGELTEILDGAVEELADLRISARRSQIEGFPDVAVPLVEIARRLERFIEEHE
jgi:hypothetical protein